MSFMFNPNPYNEPSALNKPKLSDDTVKNFVAGIANVAD